MQGVIDEAQHAKAKAMLEEQGAQTKTLLGASMLFILTMILLPRQARDKHREKVRTRRGVLCRGQYHRGGSG